jgi:L-threonylcarbamoyladenylate synthase
MVHNKMRVLSGDEIEIAATLLKQGHLVAFPTETVYGLGACAFNPEAIASIFKVKGRPSDNPLIAHVSSLEQVHEIAEEIPESFYLLAKAFFPGPIAVILKRKSSVPAIVSAGLDSIALRMPSHPLALKLISLVGQPLVAPSANLSGKPSSTQASHVLEDFRDQIAAVIDGGPTEIGIESTVISLLGKVPILLRPGVITKEQIENVLGVSIDFAGTNPNLPVHSPGMKYRHYAPKAPMRVFESLGQLQSHILTQTSGSKRMILSREKLTIDLLGADAFALLTKEFYSALRLADEQNYTEILVYCDSESKKQSGLMNRINRAATG